MDERRRFQIALGGVASCVLIAAMFVSSAPPLEYPAVGAAPQPFVSVEDIPPVRPTLLSGESGTPEGSLFLRSRRRRPAPTIPRDGAFPAGVASHVTTVSAKEATADDVPLPARAPRVVLTTAPVPRAASLAVSVDTSASASHDETAHGPLTGALATAGKEMGRGFRTAGRAIKAIF